MRRLRTHLRTTTVGVASPWLPSALFAAGEQGYWLDPSDFSTMFQDAAGTTPVTATGQSVRLMLDKSKGLVLGPELVTNGGFSNGTTGWTGVNGTLSASSGACVITADGLGQARASQNITTVAGRFYEARATVARGTGLVSVDLLISGIANSASVSTTTPTEVVVRFAATGASTTVRAGSTGTAVAGTTYIVDNISVRELAGNHFTQANVANAPVLQQDASGRFFLLFDGTDDWLQSVATINPGAVDKAQVFTGVRKLSDAAAAILVEASANAAVNNGAFFFSAPETTAAANYGFSLRGSTGAVLTATTFAAPNTSVLSCQYDIAQPDRTTEIIPRVNGVTPTLTAGGASNAGTGNFLTYTHFIGRRAGTSLPFNGRVYQMVMRYGPNLTAGQITQTETFVNARTGAY